jgi:hypothetical protein
MADVLEYKVWLVFPEVQLVTSAYVYRGESLPVEDEIISVGNPLGREDRRQARVLYASPENDPPISAAVV